MRTGAMALILMAVSYFAAVDQSGTTTVEEVLAVVGNTPILYSDVTLAAIVRLVEHQQSETEDEYRSRLLSARIRLEIEFRDLEESGLLFRLELDPSSAREALIARGGGVDQVDRQLPGSGLLPADLEELALRIAAVDAYVNQRLRPRVSVSTEEIEAAYQELLVAEIATADEPPPPLAVIRDQLRAVLVERKLNEEIERWIDRAGERQEVTRFSQ